MATPSEKRLLAEIKKLREENKNLKAKVIPKKRKKQRSRNTLVDSYILLQPDRPDIWLAAGFEKNKKLIKFPKKELNLHTLYYAENDSEYYSASFFGGEFHVQLIPLFTLPEFLEMQIKIDDEHGKFYDLITIKESSKNEWGRKFDSAEELLLFLEQYKRHGALIGEGQSFEYIQVCYIILEYQ